MTVQDSAQRQEVASQHSIIGNHAQPAQQTHTSHPDAQWFSGPIWGVFFHWGISSVLGTGDLSWSMMKREGNYRQDQLSRYGVAAVQSVITPEKYWAQAKDFKPARYDPTRWLTAIRDAGATYAVLTTKHHDGFALWPSQFGQLNTSTYAGGVDLVGEYVKACRACGIKVGLYYSPPDWHFHRHTMSFAYGDKKYLDMHHQPVARPVLSTAEQQKLDADYRALIRGQVTELLTRYGKIDLLWFDGDANGAITLAEIRQMQPGIVINRRGHGEGDFQTPECAFPKAPIDGWWEYCHIWNDGAWGYLKHEIYKPTGWMLSEMCKAASWGGNFLVNMAPDAHGQLPTAAYARLREVQEWMTRNAASLKHPAPQLWPQRCNVPVTGRADHLFLHVLFHHEGAITLSDARTPRTVQLLATGQAIHFRTIDAQLHIEIPDDLRTDLVDVIEVIF